MEIEHIEFTSWRWRSTEISIPVAACSYFVDADLLGTRFHWFLKKTVAFEMYGSKDNILRFVQAQLEDGTCRSITLPQRLRAPLLERINSTPST
jgi:hypothetical protein